MNTDELVDSLERCFISPNVSDSNMEPANVVDVIDRAARNLSRIAHAITPTDAAAMKTPDGGRVGSLTEAVIYAADSLTKIAEAIGDQPLTSDCHGMSLRDYFAAKAMQMEMPSARQRYDSGAIEADEWRQVQAWVADYAYEMADEMLRARAAVDLCDR